MKLPKYTIVWEEGNVHDFTVILVFYMESNSKGTTIDMKCLELHHYNWCHMTLTQRKASLDNKIKHLKDKFNIE